MADGERTLIVCRHAKSAWPAELSDFERPLAERGLRDAPALGRWLHGHAPEIDLVVCSPATRARETWKLAAAELGTAIPVQHEDRVYGATAGELIAVADELPEHARTVVLVGHNPGLENLVAVLTGEGRRLKTSSVAVLAGRGPWSGVEPGWGRFVTGETPRG